MEVIKVYHYTNFTKVGQIFGKIQDVRQKSGLKPSRYIGQVFGQARERPATFALLEPLPDTWVNNKHFPLTWKTLVHDLDILGDGKLLLEICINPQKDEVLIADRSHIEGALYSDKTNIPEKYRHKSLEEGERSFMESAIPLKEYLEKQGRGEISYSLPEVVIFNSVPPERIKVSESQPLIEEDLVKLRSGERNFLVNLILHGYASRELATWRQDYELINGSLRSNAGPELLG